MTLKCDACGRFMDPAKPQPCLYVIERDGQTLRLQCWKRMSQPVYAGPEQ